MVPDDIIQCEGIMVTNAMLGRLMQSISVKTLFGILALLPALAFGDELWDKAVKTAGDNWSIYPGTMVEHERVYDLKGRLEEYTRSEYRLRFDLQKGLQVRLVKAQKNHVKGKVKTEIEFADFRR